MRTARLLVAFALSTIGCTYYMQPDHDGTYAATSHDDRCVASNDGSAEDIESSASVDAPPPAHAPREEGTFEIVARAVLESIPYKDCGTGGRGDIDVTFMPNGSVQKVVVYADAWQDSAKQCVSERFALAHVAPFAGDARTVRWHAQLGDPSWGA